MTEVEHELLRIQADRERELGQPPRTVALLRRSEWLIVLGHEPGTDQMGAYRDLATALLESGDQIDWYVEDPTGRVMLSVPARFIAALLGGEAEEAAELLSAAVLAYNEKKETP